MEKIGNYRWTICGLVFFATTVNYLDRQVISLLKSTLSQELNWNDGDYANIEIAFKLFYAFGMLGAGRLVDKLGTKIGYAVATTLWSIAALAHALVNTVFGFAVVRSALGITEAGNFPAAIKTVAEWFPKKERAFATGIFNSGTNFGAIIAPLSVPFIAAEMGWQWAFIITGMLGFVWLVLWLMFYETPAKSPRLSKAEYDYIHSDAAEVLADKNDIDKPQVSWAKLLSFRQTWAFAIGKLLTDPIWWFYLFWLPDFLQSQYKLSGTGIAVPVAVVYSLSTIGSIVGGYLPMYLIKIGWPVFRARKTSMLIYAFCVSPIIFAQILGSMSMWYAVCGIGFAAAAHQAWSANIFTTVSDMVQSMVNNSLGMFLMLLMKTDA